MDSQVRFLYWYHAIGLIVVGVVVAICLVAMFFIWARDKWGKRN